MSDSDYTVRLCTPADAATVARHRVGMFRDMGQLPPALEGRMLEESTAALAIALGNATYAGWFALDAGGAVIAGAGVHIKPQLPRVTPDGQGIAASPAPLVVNVYTEPAWRGRGIARLLMHRLLGWAQSEGYDRVSLHASDAGRPLYASLGFKPTNEMRWSRGS
jgi:GNAT superfamily N-acetyltransferase